MSYIGDIINGSKTLLTGMSITGNYFFKNLFTRKDVITQLYPDNMNELKMFDRFKGEVIMFHDENNQHKCDACTNCEIICPNGSIEIVWERVADPETGKNKKVLLNHIYHLEMCTMCGLCIEVCPADAIGWGQDFHHVTRDRADLTKVLNKPGSSIMPGVKEKK
jgi:NADH-quinone oxidoreductase subunit I